MLANKGVDRKLLDRFKIAYNEVFDKKGMVKLCGREVVSKLIGICQEIDSESQANFYGSRNYGIMNAGRIKKLAKDLARRYSI